MFLAAHGRGDECKHDFDGDEVKDKHDACARDVTMSAVDFTKHVVFRPDGKPTQDSAFWKVENHGREVRAKENDGSIFIGWYLARQLAHATKIPSFTHVFFILISRTHTQKTCNL